MICCRPANLLFIRSNHNLIAILKNPKCAWKKEKNSIRAKALQYPKGVSNNEKLNAIDIIPKQLRRRTTTNSKLSQQLYLANDLTAKKIAQHLTNLPDLSRTTFVETNPGPGLLTGCLLQSEMKDLRLFEASKEFMTHLTVRTKSKSYELKILFLF